MNSSHILILAAICILQAGCAQQSKDTPSGETSGEQLNGNQGFVGNTGLRPPEREPLIGLLEKQKEQFYSTADPKIAETVDLSIDEIRTMGIEQSALGLDDVIPMFTLPNASGRMIRIAELLEKGPVVLIWYRGPWCPYCNLQLREMQAYLPSIEALGASLVAISSTLPDSSLSMSEKLGLEYQVLSDSGNVIAEQFGLKYKMPQKYQSMLKKQHSLKAYYGNDKGELPFTMTYVVDQKGSIKYAFGDSDYRMRAEPHEITDILTRIQSGEKLNSGKSMQ